MPAPPSPAPPHDVILAVDDATHAHTHTKSSLVHGALQLGVLVELGGGEGGDHVCQGRGKVVMSHRADGYAVSQRPQRRLPTHILQICNNNNTSIPRHAEAGRACARVPIGVLGNERQIHVHRQRHPPRLDLQDLQPRRQVLM